VRASYKGCGGSNFWLVADSLGHTVIPFSTFKKSLELVGFLLPRLVFNLLTAFWFDGRFVD